MMMMNNKYKLIHIDTLEVTMCEKITIDEKDYYCNKDTPKKYYIDDTNTIREPVTDDIHYWESRFSYNNIIAATNTSLQCPQVVDYVSIIAEEIADDMLNMSDIDDYASCYKGAKAGYNKHSETHSLSDEDVIKFAWWFINTPQTSGGTIKETIKQFKSTIPTKVYYR